MSVTYYFDFTILFNRIYCFLRIVFITSITIANCTDSSFSFYIKNHLLQRVRVENTPKNESIYKTKVPLKLKNEAISKVNEIRKKVYDYQILN